MFSEGQSLHINNAAKLPTGNHLKPFFTPSKDSIKYIYFKTVTTNANLGWSENTPHGKGQGDYEMWVVNEASFLAAKTQKFHWKLCILFAEIRVFERSIAIVIGPTPPGTGVIAEATLQASS